MANFNKVLLMGNLTRDPQLSYLPSQTAVVDFGLAVNRRWKSREGEDRDETCFIDCRAFGRQAENINKYLTKGRPVFVEGRLTFDSWTAQDGTRRSKHRVTVERFQFLPGTAKTGADQAEQSIGGTPPSREPGYPASAEPGGVDSTVQQPSSAGDTPADDIPF